MTPQWLQWARELQAVAQSGLRYANDPTFAGDEFDAERYERVRRVAAEMLAGATGGDVEQTLNVLALQEGDATPKVDVRGVVFDDGGEVMLVRERLDEGRWTLPGGWAEVNESPSCAVAREVEEESGYSVRVTRLLALWDRDRHDHPPHPSTAGRCSSPARSPGDGLHRPSRPTQHGSGRSVPYRSSRLHESRLPSSRSFGLWLAIRRRRPCSTDRTPTARQ